MDRREFLKTSAVVGAGLTSAGLPSAKLAGAGLIPKPARQRPAGTPQPIIHTSDLYRPHDDPDDHWDLTSIFALQQLGHLDLKAVILDFPRADRRGDPDLMAVAQMNYITGKTTPIVIGPPPLTAKSAQEGPQAGTQHAAVQMLLKVLRDSEYPVAIHIGGASQAVALALRHDPDLFHAKCAGIYLDAGYGTQHYVDHTDMEPNAHADPASFSQLFLAPCPLFWFPCFESNWQGFHPSAWGTYYNFAQTEMLPALSEVVQQFFALVYRDGVDTEQTSHPVSPNWLRDLLAPLDRIQASKMGYIGGNMWSSAGIFSAAGMAVTPDGKLVPQANHAESVFELLPVNVTCSPEGITSWVEDPSAKNRFLFHVRDEPHYRSAMSSALKTLVSQLGRV